MERTVIVELPSPYAFPIGSRIRAGQYRGEVVEIRGPWSVVIVDQAGLRLVTTTTDAELDRDLDQADAPAPAASQLSLL